MARALSLSSGSASNRRATNQPDRAASAHRCRLGAVVKPSDVLWPRARHTEAKHQLLTGYLDAWIGILGSWADHVLLIDGFAGPGEYAGGEPGSPVLMLDAFLRRAD